MRTFVSYGPVDVEAHYYAPRTELIDFTYQQLLGENPERDGHYITVWAPRQTGKTWIMQQVITRLQALDQYDVAIISLQSAKSAQSDEEIFQILVDQLNNWFGIQLPVIQNWSAVASLFTAEHFVRPVILILLDSCEFVFCWN